MSSNQAPAYIRTGTPIGAGAVIVYLAQRVFGLELSSEDITLLLPIVMSAYYVLGRAAENLHPKLGYILGIAKQPAYSEKPPPQPAPVLAEDVKPRGVPAAEFEDGDEIDSTTILDEGTPT